MSSPNAAMTDRRLFLLYKPIVIDVLIQNSPMEKEIVN